MGHEWWRVTDISSVIPPIHYEGNGAVILH